MTTHQGLFAIGTFQLIGGPEVDVILVVFDIKGGDEGVLSHVEDGTVVPDEHVGALQGRLTHCGGRDQLETEENGASGH